MGGIGKTTLARAIFNRISSQFEKAHFQDNVRKECEKSELTYLSQKVLFAIVDDKDANLDFIFTKRRLCSMKILICFDDVTCFEQIEKFTGDCFGSGSRIIITSRDKQVLKTCGVEQDYIYKVKELSYYEALELFCRHAFKQNQPTAGYMELSELALTFAKGIPLALKTLGGLLFEKTKSEWEDELNKLERISNPKIEDVLKISYDGLDDEHKNIFLDIACFFNGDDKNFVMKILDDNGFAAKSGVSALIDKSLITQPENDKIIMHDLLQEMGRKIVSKESKNLGKRSRLWHREDINRVLKTNMGTGAIECIRLEMSKAKPFKLHPHAFSNMHNLRFLDFYCDIGCSCNFYNSHCKGGYICKEGEIDNKVHPSEDLEFVLFELRYFCWYGYPLPSLPSTFDVENLVSLVMPCSKIKILNFVQQYDKLKHINLSNSKLLTRIQDLSMIPNVQSLILEGCTSLIKVFSSKKYLEKLAIINLRGCKSLKSFPNTSCLKSLESLDLSSCQIPKSFGNLSQLSFLRKLFLVGQNFELIPGIEKLSNLVTLHVCNCQRLRSLPELSNLVELDVSNCQRLRSLPELSNLVTLHARNCQRLRSLPELPGLYNLYADNCTSLEALRVPLLRRTTIRLANCHKLDRNVLKANVENALELYAERRKHSAPFLQGCFPGNEIPNWYSYQNMGSSMIIKLLPDLTNYKSIVFDVCFVVNPHHPVDHGPPLLDSELFDEYWHYHFHSHVEKHYIPLDHVCVMGMSVEKQGDEHAWNELGNASVFLHFHCLYENLKYCEVKKCGVNISYEKAEKEESTQISAPKKRRKGKSSGGSSHFLGLGGSCPTLNLCGFAGLD
ncbi:disease resistance protein RRS1-like [Pistacia vera]|uniref:disease resistance protein RRS1-like n=1 Tax=Pistacia vera TaxID=55513 RepID=UPI001263541D|nr:disease resistance protein RRS1-like [Pistacia vera]